jgi:hypothetical protein
MSDPTLATIQARLDGLCAFVGYDPINHAPLDEIVTIDDRLRTMDAALELLQARLQFQLAEVLVRLRALQKDRP